MSTTTELHTLNKRTMMMYQPHAYLLNPICSLIYHLCTCVTESVTFHGALVRLRLRGIGAYTTLLLAQKEEMG